MKRIVLVCHSYSTLSKVATMFVGLGYGYGGDTYGSAALGIESAGKIMSAEVTRITGPAGLTLNAAGEPTVAARSEDGVAVLHANHTAP